MGVLGFLAAAALLAPSGAPVVQDMPLRPAEVVASRMRDVLMDHDNGAAWQELAGALPEMALTGGADIESTFEAARIAEEMVPAVAIAEPVASTGRGAGGTALAFLRTVDVDLAGQFLAIAFGLFALSMLFKKGPRRRGARDLAGTVRCKEARALAAGGVPAYEISRRTGLAREAVSVLLSRAAR